MLCERSSNRTISVGLLTISGEAVSDNFILKVSSQLMRAVLISLLALVIPMVFLLSESRFVIRDSIYVMYVRREL